MRSHIYSIVSQDIMDCLLVEYSNDAVKCHDRGEEDVTIQRDVVYRFGTSPEPRSLYGVSGSRVVISDMEFNIRLLQLMTTNVHVPGLKEAVQEMRELIEKIFQQPPPVPQTAAAAAPTSTAAPSQPKAALITNEDEETTAARIPDRKRPAPTQPAVASSKRLCATPEPVLEESKAAAAPTESEKPAAPTKPVAETDAVSETHDDFPMETDNDNDTSTEPKKDEESVGDAATVASSFSKKDEESVGDAITVASSSSKSVGSKKRGKSKSKKAGVRKSTVYETEGFLEQIPFSKVRLLLKKAGYRFYNGLYCRPRGDPKLSKKAKKEGEDYFISEDDFRKFLCKHGVDCNGKEWKEEEKELIRKWVRHAVITSRDSKMPAYSLNAGDATRMLRIKLGFKHINEMHVGYLLPGCLKKDLQPNVNFFEDAEDSSKLWVYLAKHGLPDNCNFEKISAEERLALEQYITDNAKVDTFREKGDPESWRTNSECASPESVAVGVDDESSTVAAESSGGQNVSASPESDKEAVAASCCITPRGKGRPKDLPRRRILDQFVRSLDDEQRSRGSSKKDSSFSLPGHKHDSAADSSISLDRRTTRRAATITHDASIAKSVPKLQALKKNHAPKPAVVLPERESTVGAKLKRCIEVLKLSNTPGGTPAGFESGNLALRLDKISNFLTAVIQSKGEHGGRPGKSAALHVCGVPGAGKTMGVKWCCQKVLDSVSEKAETWELPPTFCHINASTFQNMSKKLALDHATEEIVKCMGGGKVDKNLAKALRLSEDSDTQKSTVILVIDEIDLLVSEKASTQSEEFLKVLLSWASDERMAFAIVGISNSVDNMKGRRLHSLGSFQDKVVFETYGKEELVKIVEARIGRLIVDPKVVEFMASKVAATSGDARKVLELTSKAIEKCREKLSPEQLAATEGGTVVKLPFAMMAIRENIMKYADLINDLPLMAKATLCVATRLARSKISSQLTLGLLMNYCKDAFEQDALLEELGIDGFKSTVEMLVDWGLLCLAACDQKRLSTESLNNLSSMPIQLDLQLEDVESAVESELLTQNFYRSLMDKLGNL